jgi:hypothetical protein
MLCICVTLGNSINQGTLPMKLTSFAAVFAAIVIGVIASAPGSCAAQDKSAQLERGKYLVEQVARRADCHSPLNEKGEPLPGKELRGAALTFRWLRLGIGIERIRPGHPQQNGRHEPHASHFEKRSHQTACRQLSATAGPLRQIYRCLQQPTSRQALHMHCPAEVYQPATCVYTGLPDIDYPLHDKTIVVTRCGRICVGNKKINFSQVFAGQAVGIKEVHDDIWLVSFMDYDLGYSDLDNGVLEPLENPFGPKVLPMS